MIRCFCFAIFALVVLFPVRSACARSQQGSQASAASLAAAAALAPAAFELLAAAGELSVVALHPVERSVDIVLSTRSDGATLALRVSAEALQASGVVVGMSLSVVTVGAGVLILAGETALAFVASPQAAALIHARELSR